jgi:hypothetical protein
LDFLTSPAALRRGVVSCATRVRDIIALRR